MNSTDLARLHVETAVKLTSVDRVKEILAEYETGSSNTASATPTKSTRGRKPGAAAPESRCHWNIGTEAQCKNNQKDGNSYCGMHIGKIHLIDSTATASASIF